MPQSGGSEAKCNSRNTAVRFNVALTCHAPQCDPSSYPYSPGHWAGSRLVRSPDGCCPRFEEPQTWDSFSFGVTANAIAEGNYIQGGNGGSGCGLIMVRLDLRCVSSTASDTVCRSARRLILGTCHSSTIRWITRARAESRWPAPHRRHAFCTTLCSTTTPGRTEAAARDAWASARRRMRLPMPPQLRPVRRPVPGARTRPSTCAE